MVVNNPTPSHIWYMKCKDKRIPCNEWNMSTHCSSQLFFLQLSKIQYSLSGNVAIPGQPPPLRVSFVMVYHKAWFITLIRSCSLLFWKKQENEFWYPEKDPFFLYFFQFLFIAKLDLCNVLISPQPTNLAEGYCYPPSVRLSVRLSVC